jgi:hypothetical protein
MSKKSAAKEAEAPPVNIPTGSINEPNAPRTMPGPMSINEPGPPPAVEAAPVIDELIPDGATIGDADFTLDVVGTGFSANSVIVFAGHDEPTTWNEEDGTVSTGVNMAVWLGPDAVPVAVRNGSAVSNTLDFTFSEEPPVTRKVGKRTRKGY